MSNNSSHISASTKEDQTKKTKFGYVPKDWEIKKIGSIASVSVGRDLKEDLFNESKTDQHEYPVYSNTVDDFGLYGYYSSPEYESPSVTVVGRGVGLGTAFNRKEPFGAIGRLLVLHPKNGINSKFLTDVINNKVKFYKESTGVPQLTGVQIKTYSVPLPPITEQDKIAKILFKWDKAVQKLEDLIIEKEQLKKGLMQKLLIGNTRFPDFKNEWEEVRLEDLGDVNSGGTPRTTVESNWGGKIQWCTPTDITDLGGKKYIESTGRTITKQGLQNSSAKVLEANTIIVCTRATIGDMAIAKVAMATNQGFKNLTVTNDEVEPEFVYYMLLTKKKEMIRKASGTTFLELNSKDFKKIKIGIPSPPEQKKIISVFSTIDSEIKLLERQKRFIQHQKQGVMQELLTGKTRLKQTKT